jgi:hypothetical protein
MAILYSSTCFIIIHIFDNQYELYWLMFQDFDLVVLDEMVLLVAQRYRQDVLAAGHDDDFNRGKRHAAYRQFILIYE